MNKRWQENGQHSLYSEGAATSTAKGLYMAKSSRPSEIPLGWEPARSQKNLIPEAYTGIEELHFQDPFGSFKSHQAQN